MVFQTHLDREVQTGLSDPYRQRNAPAFVRPILSERRQTGFVRHRFTSGEAVSLSEIHAARQIKKSKVRCATMF